MALYEQTLTGQDSDIEPTNDPVIFTMSGPGAAVPDVNLAPTVDNEASFSWNTANVGDKVDTTITFTCTDMYGAEVNQTINMVSWFAPYINQVENINQPAGIEYTATVEAITREVGLNLTLTYDFPGADEPVGFTWLDNGNGTADITWTPIGGVSETNFDVTATDDGVMTLTDTQNVLIRSYNLPPVFDSLTASYGGMDSFVMTLQNGDFEFDGEARSSSVGVDNITGWTVETGTMNVVYEEGVPIPIVNAGAESGDMTGWHQGTGLYYSSEDGTTSPHTGDRFFHGGSVGSTGECEMYSDPMDLSDWATETDTGTSQITLDYWQLSFAANNDPGRAMIRYYSDVAGTVLISSDNNVYYNGPDQTWENRSDTYTIPATTRSVRIVGQCNIIGLNYASAYFDDWSLTYIPEEVAVESLITTDDEIPAIGFGDAVSIDGTTAVIGASLDDTNASNSGAVYVYTGSGGTWTQQQKILGKAEISYFFGHTVDISGDTLVVGIPNADGENVASGEVIVYTRTGGVWSPQQTLTPPTQVHAFGWSVAIKGDDLAIGAISHLVLGQRDKGQAYVYTRTGGVWSLQDTIIGDDIVDKDEYGSSIAIDTDIVIVGSNHKIASNDAYGAIYVFTRSGETWTQQQKLTATVPQNDTAMGRTLGISGDYIVASCGYYADTYTNQGCIYIFKNNTGTWSQHQLITASDAAGNDEYFGGYVDIDGDTIVVKTGERGIPLHGKYIYSYKLNTGTWGSETKFIPQLDGDDNPPDQGNSLAERTVSISGNTILAGFSLYLTAALSNIGAAITFGTVINGNYVMDAGTDATSSGESNIISIGANATDIDAGNITLRVHGDQSSRSVTDSGQFGLRFYDQDDVFISEDTNTSIVVFPSNWTRRIFDVAVPVGARKITIIWAATGDGTGDNDVLFDNFTVSVR